MTQLQDARIVAEGLADHHQICPALEHPATMCSAQIVNAQVLDISAFQNPPPGTLRFDKWLPMNTPGKHPPIAGCDDVSFTHTSMQDD